MAGIPKVKITFDADFDELKKGVKGASDEVESFSTRAAEFGKKAALAFAVVGAAVTAFAVSAVKAAAEDEAAQQKLAQTLKATTDATQAQVDGIDRYITKVSIASARTDDELRPALSRLARSTGDVEEAQKLLTLSLDISAATGKSLETVSNALARANEGNTTALSKLGLGIDATTLKNQSLDVTVAQLAATYDGFSKNEAATAEGKFKSLTIATDEVKESIGAALLPVITELATYVLENVVPAIQGFVAGLTGDEGAKDALKDTQDGAVTFGEKIRGIIDTVIKFKDEIKILAGVLATVFVVGKLTAFATSMISAIKLIVAAMNALRTSSVLAGIAAYFALNPLLGIGIGAATIAGIAAFAALSRKSDVQIEARAAGGTVTGNRPYLVGEKGAELFVPTNNGAIIPNNRLGSNGQTVNINVTGAIDPIGVARQIANILNKEASLNGTFNNLGASRLVAG
jgi:hypothetical protein